MSIVQNKKAFHDYFIEQRFEAGIALEGWEVKAIRAGVTRPNAERTEIKDAILANVEQSINDALTGSEILRHAVEGGKLQIVGAYYELGSGQVTFSDPIAAPDAVAQK